MQNYGPLANFPNQNQNVNKFIVNFYLYMLSFQFLCRARVWLALTLVSLFLSNCRSAQYARIPYQRPAHEQAFLREPQQIANTDTLPSAPTAQPILHTEQQPEKSAISTETIDQPKAAYLRNPDAPKPPKSVWLHKITTPRDPSLREYAPRHEPLVLSGKRKVPGLVKASVVGGGLGQVLMLLGIGTISTTFWALSLLVPIAALLLGVAGLAKINRRREEFRGKGWAMTAIMLATGALGLAMVAAAALATSEIVK